MDSVYVVTMAIVILSMVTMIVHVISGAVLSKVERMFFSCCFAGVALGALAECGGVYLDLYHKPPTYHYVVTILEFSIIPFIPAMMAYACNIKKLARVMYIVAIAHVILEIVFIFSGGIFSITPDGVYQRGKFYSVYIAFYVISIVGLFIVFSRVSSRFQNRDLRTIICTLAVLVAGIAPTVYDGRIKTAFVSIAVASILLYIYYEGLTEQKMQEDIEKRNKRISEIQSGIIVGMANLIESRDGSTGEHVKNTADYVKLLADAALEKGLYPETLTREYANMCVSAAPLHDVGKILVPDEILNKPGKLTPEEFEIMKRHASEGGRIVESILTGVTNRQYLEIAKEVAGCHHEKWDGTGYPNGLSGENIPLCARIMAIADVYDALIAKRVYKDQMPKEKALKIITEDAGTHFDPVLAPLFVEEIRNCH